MTKRQRKVEEITSRFESQLFILIGCAEEQAVAEGIDKDVILDSLNNLWKARVQSMIDEW